MRTVDRGRPARRPRFLAVDVSGALHVVGTLTAYLSAATLVPAAVAVGYDEPAWPFLVAGAIAGAIGALAAFATRGDHRLGIREGFLVVSLTWLVAAALGALPYILSGDPQLDRPLDAYFEAMSGFRRRARSSSETSRRSRTARALAPADAVARRHRDHRAGARDAAAPARRRTAAAGDEMPRPGDRDAQHAHP